MVEGTVTRAAFGAALLLAAALAAQAPQLDPAAWGRDHAGAPPPQYVPGDECLFCHRETVGSNWKDTVHGASTRQREDAPALARAVASAREPGGAAKDAEYFLGSRHRARLLKPAGFGKFALLNAQAVLRPDQSIERWIDAGSPSWDAAKFADRCAGCHATAVEAKTKTFSAFGLDCYACHGDVTLEHTKDTTLIWWSRKRRNADAPDQVRAMTSICAQCHLRGGASRSAGSPYPNTFIAGDNLFRDFAVDFARAEDPALNPGDRHVWRAVRDIVVRGASGPSCTLCHRVHDDASARHELVPRSAVCGDCHEFNGSAVTTRAYEVGSAVCEYEGAPGSRRRQ